MDSIFPFPSGTDFVGKADRESRLGRLDNPNGGTDCSPCSATRRCRSGLRDEAEGKQRDHENRTESRAEPEVRIQFPRAVSQVRTAIGPPEFPKQAQAPSSTGVPMVRIHLPPADSLSLSRFCFRTLRTRLFARVWAAGLTTGSAETRQAFHCAPTGGNVSAGPYSSTAVPMMRSVQCHDGPNEVRTRA